MSVSSTGSNPMPNSVARTTLAFGAVGIGVAVLAAPTFGYMLSAIALIPSFLGAGIISGSVDNGAYHTRQVVDFTGEAIANAINEGVAYGVPAALGVVNAVVSKYLAPTTSCVSVMDPNCLPCYATALMATTAITSVTALSIYRCYTNQKEFLQAKVNAIIADRIAQALERDRQITPDQGVLYGVGGAAIGFGIFANSPAGLFCVTAGTVDIAIGYFLRKIRGE